MSIGTGAGASELAGCSDAAIPEPASCCSGSKAVHKLDTFTDLHRAAQQRMRALIWRLYDDLKAYRANPTARRRGELRARFERIFHRRTGFVTLDRLLARLHANKPELLMVLDRPDIPLHTNGSERDIRLHVTKRKVSGGTRSVDGRECRDAFLGLMRTAAKLGIAFWDYLGDHFSISGSPERSLSARHCPPPGTASLTVLPGVLPRLRQRHSYTDWRDSWQNPKRQPGLMGNAPSQADGFEALSRRSRSSRGGGRPQPADWPMPDRSSRP